MSLRPSNPREPAERQVASEIQESLAPLIPRLGHEDYQQTITRAD